MHKISCIICAYNEKQRISGVLKALKNHPLVDETIVVDDGSTDGTGNVVRAMPWVKLISHPVNRGKSCALATGIENAKHEMLLLLDADLVGITPDDIQRLIEPVMEKRAEVSMSLRKNSSIIYQLIGLDFVSGERVLPKRLFFGNLETLRKLPGFGAEVFINTLILKENLRVEVVRWKRVVNLPKTQKFGLWSGWQKELQMVREILSVTPPQEIVRQNLLMRLHATGAK